MPFTLPPLADLYPHRCTRYRPEENLAASGKSQPDTLASTVAGILCDFQTGLSVKSPTGFVLGEQDNLFTLDRLFVEDDADIQTEDVIRQTTGPEVDRYWLVRGDAKVRAEWAQMKTFELSRLPENELPDWLP